VLQVEPRIKSSTRRNRGERQAGSVTYEISLKENCASVTRDASGLTGPQMLTMRVTGLAANNPLHARDLGFRCKARLALESHPSGAGSARPNPSSCRPGSRQLAGRAPYPVTRPCRVTLSTPQSPSSLPRALLFARIEVQRARDLARPRPCPHHA
jgi:hypothetical protein